MLRRIWQDIDISIESIFVVWQISFGNTLPIGKYEEGI